MLQQLDPSCAFADVMETHRQRVPTVEQRELFAPLDDDDGMIEEAMSDGMQWLMSLEPGKTDEADTMTAGWIANWQAIERMWRS